MVAEEMRQGRAEVRQQSVKASKIAEEGRAEAEEQRRGRTEEHSGTVAPPPRHRQLQQGPHPRGSAAKGRRRPRHSTCRSTIAAGPSARASSMAARAAKGPESWCP